MTDVLKRVAVGALIRNENKELLIVKPSYKDGWLFVGGMVELGESLETALMREIKEEIGLDLEIGRLLTVDYGELDSDSINFIFDCGEVRGDVKITCPPQEITDYRFVSNEEALSLLRPKGSHRLPYVLESAANNTVAYINPSK